MTAAKRPAPAGTRCQRLLNGVTVTMEGNDNTVDVVFDVVEEKTLPVTITTNYLTIADGISFIVRMFPRRISPFPAPAVS